MNNKKNLLIIAYHYLPEIMAASYRMYAWAKYLQNYGWQPFILTRDWEQINQGNFNDISIDLVEEIDKDINCRIYRVPYKQSFERIWNIKNKLSRKLAPSYKELFIRKLINFLSRNIILLPDDKIGWYENAFKASLSIIQNHSIQAILSTGAPWTNFKIAYNLSKRTAIPWVADYRDPWSQLSTLGLNKKDIIWFIFSRLYEKKITRTASSIIHVSEYYKNQLEKIVKRRVNIIPNGYDPEKFKKYAHLKADSNIFKISCIGTKHPVENTKVFLKGFQMFVRDNKIFPEKCKVEFVGHGHKRIKNEFSNFRKIEKFINFTPPIPQDEAIQSMYRSHILLLFPSDIEGVCSAKLFDYLASRRTILASPGGLYINLVKSILEKTNGGLVLDDVQQVSDWLKERFHEFVTTKQVKSTTKWPAVKEYSRKNQAEKLSIILDNVVSRDA